MHFGLIRISVAESENFFMYYRRRPQPERHFEKYLRWYQMHGIRELESFYTQLRGKSAT